MTKQEFDEECIRIVAYLHGAVSSQGERDKEPWHDKFLADQLKQQLLTVAPYLEESHKRVEKYMIDKHPDYKPS